MALARWRGSATAVAQVDKFTPATVEVNDIFTLTLTDDNGATVAISFTATATTVANVTAGLTAAWNASTDPRAANITAADVTTYMTLTADTAGRPFSVASSTTDGGGAATQTLTRAVTTASSGPNDWGVVANWSTGAVPTTGDDVEIPAGTAAILYGLNQSAVNLGDFVRKEGHITNIGRMEYGFFYHLRFDANLDLLTDEGGSALSMYDIGASAIAPTINNTGTPSTGLHAVYIKGTAMSSINILSGNVGIGTEQDDTTTEVDAININGTLSTVTVGAGVSDIDNNAIDSISIYNGAACYNNAAVTLVTCNDSTYHQDAGNWTTLNAYGQKTKVYPNATGTYVTTNIRGDAQLLNTLDLRTKTFTSTTLDAGCKLSDPLNKITQTNPITVSGGLMNTTIDKGLSITVAIAAV